MKANEIIYNDLELLNLRNDTVTPETMLYGAIAHDASGNQITGAIIINDEAAGMHYDNTESELDAENVQDALDEIDYNAGYERRRAQQAESVLTESLSTEISRATEAESGLQGAIDGISNKIGSSNGIAELDENGTVPASQLPSCVNEAYDHSQITSGNPHNVTKEDVGLENVPNVSTNNQTPIFSESGTRANITSGETLSVLFGKIKKFFTDLKTVAFTGSYSDLSDKPTIPSVGNATLTIQKNGSNVQTFTANATSNATANITVPTKVSDLSNDSGFINYKAVSTVANQNLTEAEKAAARANIDAGSSSANGTVTSIATGAGLTGGTITNSGTIKANLKSETKSTLEATTRGTTANREYPVGLDKNGKLSVNVPWTDTIPTGNTPTVGTENLTESADGYTFTHTYPDKTEVTAWTANGLSAVKTITYTSGDKYTVTYTFNSSGKTASIVTAKA